MFNRKIEIKLVKDNKNPVEPAAPKDLAADYVAIAEQAVVRIGAKIVIGVAATIVVSIVANKLGDAAIIALDAALNKD